MPTRAKHRTVRGALLLRRAGSAGLAGAASIAGVGLTAQTAVADDHNVWDRVAQCESTGNWSINTGNGFYGGLQFWHPTWQSFGGGEFAGYAHQATKLQQITVAQRVLQVQGPGAWPVCSVRAGLTMANGSQPYPGEAAPTPDPGTQGTWWVSASAGANIRSGPSTSYAVVGGAARGAKITGSLSSGWVKLADGRGWVSAATLTTSDPGAPEPAPQPPPAAASTWKVTATGGANLRSGPGTSYAVVGGFAHGATFSGSLSGGWVKLADGRGWVSGSIVAAVTAGGGGGGSSDMAPLVVDGSRGPLTVKAVQRWAGVAETGRWDSGTLKALQRTVGTEADGAWGPKSQAALQDKIGLTRDGSTYMNYRTIVGLQKWLNANVIG
ncbi:MULTISPECIES: transglycosylase family protein [unclassified Ornithinimicrobium]|uniref:transglycosylase family protein n=1 Tax=unclassified Ornithinimicrobium TaxID=2615080 RepID=UPI0038546E8B